MARRPRLIQHAAVVENPDFGADAIFTRPGESLVETVARARKPKKSIINTASRGDP